MGDRAPSDSLLATVLKNSWVGNLLWLASGALGLILGSLYVFQDNLLYHPSIPGIPQTPRENPPQYRSPDEYGINFEDHYINTSDGAVVHAWIMLRPEEGAPTIVYFHGNAGNMGFRLPNGVNMYTKLKCNVVLTDYRGYGHSEGKPSEAGLLKDAEAVLQILQKHPKIDRKKIIVYGKSLGGAVAVALAERHPDQIMALMLENTFLSIPAMVDTLMPYVRYFKSLILRIRWATDERIPKITQPIFFISGLADELVPPLHMEKLYRLAKSSKKAVLYRVPGGTHNETMIHGGIAYYRAMLKFIEDALALLGADGECLNRNEEEEEALLRKGVQERHATIPAMPVFNNKR